MKSTMTSCCFLGVLTLLTLRVTCQSQVIPTSNTSSTEYYIASAVETTSTFQYQEIICNKLKDCHIVCDTPNGCQGTHIGCWDNRLCNVTCSAANACSNMNVTYFADTAYRSESTQFVLHCSADSNQAKSSAVCSSMAIHGEGYASNVQIHATNAYAIYQSTFDFDTSWKTVQIFASGALAFSESTLFARRTDSVFIECVSQRDTAETVTDSACYRSNWYLPVADSGDYSDYAEINCYGPGCKNMGSLHFAKWYHFDWNVNGCGQCETAAECIGGVYFNCEYFNGTQCLNRTYTCECTGASRYSLLFSNDATNENCYEPYQETAGEEEEDNESTLPIYSFIGLGVAIVVLGCICYTKRRKKREEAMITHVTPQPVAVSHQQAQTQPQPVVTMSSYPVVANQHGYPATASAPQAEEEDLPPAYEEVLAGDQITNM